MSQIQQGWWSSFGRGSSAYLHNDWLSLRRYGFKLGGLGFLLPEESPGEVVKEASICPIPYTKGWLKGVFNLRGNLIPVFDVQQMLFRQPVAAPMSMKEGLLLVLGKGRNAVAITLETPPQLLTGLQPLPAFAEHVPELLRDQVTKAYRSDPDQIWLVFSPGSFFNFLADNAKLC